MDQAAGQRFHVTPRNGLHQEEFNHLMIAQSLCPAVQKPLAQAPAMPAGVGAEFGTDVGDAAGPVVGGAGFVEQGRLLRHDMHKQLPFRSARRK